MLEIKEYPLLPQIEIIQERFLDSMCISPSGARKSNISLAGIEMEVVLVRVLLDIDLDDLVTVVADEGVIELMEARCGVAVGTGGFKSRLLHLLI